MQKNKQLNSYDLSRSWFDFCFENPELISPSHTAVYFFAIEHCNRLGWKQKFGFPTTMVMEAVGIKSYNTYKKILLDLVSFGFIKMIETSKNQYSANIIALSNFDKALNKSLDKALIKHNTKQVQSTKQSISSINKQETNNQLNKETKESNLIFPFHSENFVYQWQIWKTYKKEQHRFTYKSEATEQAALTQLQKMATNQERKAIEIIHHTMANGWKGFVEPKTDPRKETQDAFQAVKDKINFDFSDGKLSFER